MVVRVPLNAHVLTELNLNSRIVGNPSVTRPNGQRVRCGLPVIRPEPGRLMAARCLSSNARCVHWRVGVEKLTFEKILRQ